MIKEKLKRYVDILNDIPEMQDKYLWLMEFGKKNEGLVCLLADIFSGFTGSDIASFDTKSLDDLKLDTLLTPGRRNGVYSMLKKIQGYGRRAA